MYVFEYKLQQSNGPSHWPPPPTFFINQSWRPPLLDSLALPLLVLEPLLCNALGGDPSSFVHDVYSWRIFAGTLSGTSVYGDRD